MEEPAMDHELAEDRITLAVPARLRRGIKNAAVVPMLFLLVTLMLFPLPFTMWFSLSMVDKWGLPRWELILLPFMAVAIILSLSLCSALTFIVHSLMAPNASTRLARHVTKRLGLGSEFESLLYRRLKRTLWIDWLTKTVPTPYRRIEVDPAAKRNVPYWVMDVGKDFTSITFELYQPGEVPSPRLTKTKNPADGYAYYEEWKRSKGF